MLESPAFEIVTTRLGVTSIRDNTTKEIMHNPVGPWAEANSLYIEQSRLSQRLLEDLDPNLVIYDIGLGAGANALAALHCARKIQERRPMKLISFERDLTLLQFALDHSQQFDHFSGFEESIQSILDHGQWSEKGIQWELRHGDYLDLIENEPDPAHLVFFDPYSAKKNAEMWNVAAFRKTFQKCSREGATLYTYSRATPVRVALLLAGFYVGVGDATGPKEETTQASTRLKDLKRPLDQTWIERWERSHNPNASGAKPEELEEVRRLVRSHPQFN